MKLKVIFINCTERKSPKPSFGETLANHAATMFREHDVETECLRMIDYLPNTTNTAAVTHQEGWAQLFKKIVDTDMLVLTMPMQNEERTSVAKHIEERLAEVLAAASRDTGQYPTIPKVAGVLALGDEGHVLTTLSQRMFQLSANGYTLPPRAFTHVPCKRKEDPPIFNNKHLDKQLLLMVANMVQASRTLRRPLHNASWQKMGATVQGRPYKPYRSR